MYYLTQVMISILTYLMYEIEIIDLMDLITSKYLHMGLVILLMILLLPVGLIICSFFLRGLLRLLRRLLRCWPGRLLMELRRLLLDIFLIEPKLNMVIMRLLRTKNTLVRNRISLSSIMLHSNIPNIHQR